MAFSAYIVAGDSKHTTRQLVLAWKKSEYELQRMKMYIHTWLELHFDINVPKQNPFVITSS